MSFRENIAPVSIIVAVDLSGGFSKNNKIPWIDEPWAKEDLKHFQETTKGKVCIMGRNTYEDMLHIMKARGKKEEDIKEILPGRTSFVLTRNPDYKAVGATVAKNITDAVQSLPETDKREIMILGGEKLFIEALALTSYVYMTIINGYYDCDRFFPVKVLTDKYKIIDGSKTDHLTFVKYIRIK